MNSGNSHSDHNSKNQAAPADLFSHIARPSQRIRAAKILSWVERQEFVTLASMTSRYAKYLGGIPLCEVDVKWPDPEFLDWVNRVYGLGY